MGGFVGAHTKCLCSRLWGGVSLREGAYCVDYMLDGRSFKWAVIFWPLGFA